jgi:hypothetical protein
LETCDFFYPDEKLDLKIYNRSFMMRRKIIRLFGKGILQKPILWKEKI